MVSGIEIYIQKSGAVICSFWMFCSGVISRGSYLVEGRESWFFCLFSGMTCFKWPWDRSLFSHVRNWGGQVTGHFEIDNDQTESLSNWCLSWETDESGGHESKVGDNTVPQIVPSIRWIIIYININIPTKQELRLPIVQCSLCEGVRLPLVAQNEALLSQRGCLVTRLNWGSWHCRWNQLA